MRALTLPEFRRIATSNSYKYSRLHPSTNIKLYALSAKPSKLLACESAAAPMLKTPFEAMRSVRYFQPSPQKSRSIVVSLAVKTRVLCRSSRYFVLSRASLPRADVHPPKLQPPLEVDRLPSRNVNAPWKCKTATLPCHTNEILLSVPRERGV